MKKTLIVMSMVLGASAASAQVGVHLDTDCSNEGGRKVLVIDNGAGRVWAPTNDTRWCDPIGHTLNPVEDPVFAGHGGSE